MSRTGTPWHYSGTAAVGPVAVTLQRALGQRIKIRNLDATNGLKLNLSLGGTSQKNPYTIPAGQEFDFDCTFQQFWVSSTASTVAWCAVTIEG